MVCLCVCFPNGNFNRTYNDQPSNVGLPYFQTYPSLSVNDCLDLHCISCFFNEGTLVDDVNSLNKSKSAFFQKPS